MRLELEDCVERPEAPLLSVSARLSGLMVLMRLMVGEGASEREPSSWRVTLRCSCRRRSTRSKCFWRSNARQSSGQLEYLFRRHLGWSLLQGLGTTPSSTSSANVGFRGKGVEFEIFWWKYDVLLDLPRSDLGASKVARLVNAKSFPGGN
jgi:hypothetical protein